MSDMKIKEAIDNLDSKIDKLDGVIGRVSCRKALGQKAVDHNDDRVYIFRPLLKADSRLLDDLTEIRLCLRGCVNSLKRLDD